MNSNARPSGIQTGLTSSQSPLVTRVAFRVSTSTTRIVLVETLPRLSSPNVKKMPRLTKAIRRPSGDQAAECTSCPAATSTGDSAFSEPMTYKPSAPPKAICRSSRDQVGETATPRGRAPVIRRATPPSAGTTNSAPVPSSDRVAMPGRPVWNRIRVPSDDHCGHRCPPVRSSSVSGTMRPPAICCT